MRLLRVAPASQTVLDLPVGPDLPPVTGSGWWQLPQTARTQVVVLLARMIARGVLVEDAAPGQDPTVADRAGAGEVR